MNRPISIAPTALFSNFYVFTARASCRILPNLRMIYLNQKFGRSRFAIVFREFENTSPPPFPSRTYDYHVDLSVKICSKFYMLFHPKMPNYFALPNIKNDMNSILSRLEALLGSFQYHKVQKAQFLHMCFIGQNVYQIGKQVTTSRLTGHPGS